MGITRILFILPLLVVLIFVSGDAWAQTTTGSAKPRPFLNFLQDKNQDRQEKVASITAKRDEQKVKRCEVKEKVLATRTESLTRLVANMEAKFTAIVERVKTFATNKGLTVENYDTLLADIDTNKAAVDAALASAKTNADAFTCDSDDPKAALTSFREDMQAVKQALGDYRTAIKDLIVAVKSSASVLKEDKTEDE